MTSNEEKLGYLKQQEVPFHTVLYNKNFHVHIPENFLPNDVTKLLSSIIATNVGVPSKCNLSELAKFEEISMLLLRLIKAFKSKKIMYIFAKYCNRTNEDKNVIPQTYDDFCSDKIRFPTAFLQESVEAVNVTALHNENESSACGYLAQTEFCKTELGENDFMKMAMPWRSVYLFLRSILRTVIPIGMFGSKFNLQLYLKAVKYILLLGRYDNLYLEDVMHRIKINHCSYSKMLSSFHEKSQLVAKVFLWVLQKIVFGLIAVFFYVTESNHRKNQLFYFRKREFQSLVDNEFYSLYKDKVRIIKEEESRKLFDAFVKSYKLSSLRFIPKPNGLRMILPLKTGCLTKLECKHAVEVVRYINSNHFKSKGGAFTVKDFENAWIHYKKYNPQERPIYAVKLDIKDAYGSVIQEKLFDILNDAALKLPQQLRFCPFTTSFAEQKSRRSPVCTLAVDLLDQCIDLRYIREGPLCKAGHIFIVNTSKTIEAIKKCVTYQVGIKAKYQQVRLQVGIAQGGTFSSALCDLYYSAMCSKYLTKFEGDGRALFRCVDDLLYITPEKIQAQQFLALMEEGIPEFNCRISVEKTNHNLDGEEKRLLFRGFLLCTQTKQLLSPVTELSLYPPRYTLKLKNTMQPGKLIADKMKQIAKSRLPKLLFHPMYTSKSAIISNIWRLGISLGGRLVNLIAAFILPRKLVNVKFLSKTIIQVAHETFVRIQRVWNRDGLSVPFTKIFSELVAVAGVFVTLSLPTHPQLNDLRRKLRLKLRSWFRLLQQEEKDLVPSLKRLQKIFTFL